MDRIEIASEKFHDAFRNNSPLWVPFSKLPEELKDRVRLGMIAAIDAVEYTLSPKLIECPKNVEEAKAMWLYGERWMRDNAPDQITPEPQNIPRFEPIKREDFLKALMFAGIVANDGRDRVVNKQPHSVDLNFLLNEALRWLNDLQTDEPQGYVMIKVPLPEIEKIRDLMCGTVIPEGTNTFAHRWGAVVGLFEETYPADDSRTVAQCGNGDTGVKRASAIAAVLNFVRKLI